MIRKSGIALLILWGASSIASAYQSELSLRLGAGEGSSEFGINGNKEKSDTETEAFGIAGQFYFDQVEHGTAPFAESGFVSQTGFIGLDYASAEIESSTPGFPKSKADRNILGVGARFVSPDMVLQVEMGRSETKEGSIKLKDNEFSVGAGKYLSGSTLAIVSFYHQKEKLDGETSEQSRGFIGEVKHLASTSSSSHFSFEAQFGLLSTEIPVDGSDTDVDGITIISELGISYFPNQKTSVGLTLDTTSFDGDGEIFNQKVESTYFESGIELSGAYYLTPEISLFGDLYYSLSEDEAKASGNTIKIETEDNLLTLGLSARF